LNGVEFCRDANDVLLCVDLDGLEKYIIHYKVVDGKVLKIFTAIVIEKEAQIAA